MNKGFTLVELIAVVTILGLLAVITTPAYDTISKNIKERNYESKQSTIKAQTLAYVEKYMKNDTYDPEKNLNPQTLCFTVGYLIQNGIISSDSETDEYIENNVTGEHYENDKEYVNILYDLENLKLIAVTLDDKDLNNDNVKINGKKITFSTDNCK